MMKPSLTARSRRGFTLVEIALALAVVSVALVSMLGLMPMFLNLEVGNTATNMFPTMCSQVMGKLRAEPYPQLLPTGSRVLYFTDQGTPAANAQSAVYECEITQRALTAEAARPGGANAPTPGVHCHVVQMKFHWPVGAPGGNARIFHATMADD